MLEMSQMFAAGFDGLGIGLGCGLVTIGGGLGIGNLAGSAMEAIGRQPEATGKIQIAMIIGAALIEGFTFYSLVIVSGIGS